MILDIQQSSGLPPNAAPDVIRRFVKGSVSAQSKLDYFKRYVPARFLTPWFDNVLRGRRDAEKNSIIKSLARNSQKEPIASLYYFEVIGGRQAIKINDSWQAFLMENLGIVQSSLNITSRSTCSHEIRTCGSVEQAPCADGKATTVAREFWRLVRTDFDKAGKPAEFRDIYSERRAQASRSTTSCRGASSFTTCSGT